MDSITIEQKKYFLKGVKQAKNLIKHCSLNTLDSCIEILDKEIVFCKKDISDAEDMEIADIKAKIPG